MIRVLICDDQDVVCEGLRVILSTDPEITVVATAFDGAQAVDLVEKFHPDVVLMDLKMPVMNGVQATRLICERFSPTRVLILTTFDADDWVFDAVRAGAAGYLLKDSPRETLIQAVKDTAEGKSPVDPAVAGKLLSAVARQTPTKQSNLMQLLSERERQVLALIARGYSNGEIAAALFLSEGTVRNYVSAIFTRLGVADRTQAALLAVRHGLLQNS